MRFLTGCIACICIVVIPLPIFAQNAPLPGKTELPSYSKTLLLEQFVFDSKEQRMADRWFNSRVITARRGESKERLRELWREFLGIDVFYPYFKVKEVEKFVQSKTTIDFFNFRGRAEFVEGSSSVRYIFKKKF